LLHDRPIDVLSGDPSEVQHNRSMAQIGQMRTTFTTLLVLKVQPLLNWAMEKKQLRKTQSAPDHRLYVVIPPDKLLSNICSCPNVSVYINILLLVTIYVSLP